MSSRKTSMIRAIHRLNSSKHQTTRVKWNAAPKRTAVIVILNFWFDLLELVDDGRFRPLVPPADVGETGSKTTDSATLE